MAFSVSMKAVNSRVSQPLRVQKKNVKAANAQSARMATVCKAGVPKLADSASIATAAALALMATPLPALAEDGSTVTFALGAGGAAVAVAGLLIAADPEKRRKQMALESGDEMESVKKYFNTEGFNRWQKIYGETDEVNKVQLDIRTGHAQTVEKVLSWVDEEGGVKDVTIADCGCGTGSLAIPLALRGGNVYASDISKAMAQEAEERYQAALSKNGGTAPSVAPRFAESDLESVKGKYNTVACLDVMIHYPQDKVDGMITHLADICDDRLIISFAPKTLYYSLLKRIGELFPGPSKATRAYLHTEADVEAALNRAGFKVTKREMTATSFYFSRLLEAKRS